MWERLDLWETGDDVERVRKVLESGEEFVDFARKTIFNVVRVDEDFLDEFEPDPPD